ncbi:MAG: transporter [Sulfuricella sp.]|nr:transporter [Sulfuricella sp.]
MNNRYSTRRSDAFFSTRRIAPRGLAKRLPAALLACTCGSADAIDTYPGGYIALPAGTDVLAVYWQHAERKERYANGRVVKRDFTVKSDATTLTYGHFIDIGGFTAAPGFMLTCGNSRAAGTLAMLGRAAGCTDLIVGMPTWVVNDPANGRYLGVSPYLVAPTGAYERNAALNMGANRWKVGVNVGYVTPLVGNFHLDVVGDMVVNGKNTDYGPYGVSEEEAPVYNLQLHLRYQFNPATRVALSYLHDWGWESTIAGVRQFDHLNRGRYRVSAAQFIDRQNMLEVNFGGDTAVNNGFKVDSYTNLRYIHFF